MPLQDIYLQKIRLTVDADGQFNISSILFLRSLSSFDLWRAKAPRVERDTSESAAALFFVARLILR